MNYEGALTIIVYINKATIINFCDIDVSLKICVFCWAIVFVTLLLSVQRLGKQAPPPKSLTPLKKECLRVSEPSQCHLPYSDPSDFPFKRSFNISLRKKNEIVTFLFSDENCSISDWENSRSDWQSWFSNWSKVSGDWRHLYRIKGSITDGWCKGCSSSYRRKKFSRHHI